MHSKMELFEKKMPSLQHRLQLLVFSYQALFSKLPQRVPPLSNPSSSRSFSLQIDEPPPWHVRNSERQRSRPFPWQRSFGRLGSVAPDVIAERKLQWRTSVYDRRLQAVPSAPRSRLQVSIPINDGVKERMLRRIEPWIQRELQALPGEQDPSIIVHVVNSLFIACLENKGVPSEQCDDQDDFLAPLHPFLLDRTHMFWHELRCFPESSFNMETYDAVRLTWKHMMRWLSTEGCVECRKENLE